MRPGKNASLTDAPPYFASLLGAPALPIKTHEHTGSVKLINIKLEIATRKVNLLRSYVSFVVWVLF